MLVSNNYFISVYNFYVIFMTIVIYSGRVCRADDAERRLMKHLMADYDPAVRPVANASEVLTVTFGAALYHIIDVDERNQILTTNCWLTQIWTDHHLKWNKSEYGGIHVIRIPYNRVWLPDVILYNNADSTYQTAVINTNVIVQYTGEVVWLSHGIYKSSCEINVEYFPFDSQDCYMKWASWTYDGYQLFVVLLALSATYAAEEAKKGQKRGVFGEGLALGGHDFGHDSGLSLGGGFDGHDFGGHDFGGHGADFGDDHGLGLGGSSGLSHHGPIDLGESVHKHITITKKVGVPVPKPYPVTVEKKIPVPVPHPVAVPVDKPYPVHVPKPYPVPVEKLVPYTVTKHVPYPVKVPVKVPFKVPVAVPVPKPYPVTVTKKVPVHIPEPIIVKKPVPVFIKSHHGDDSGLSFDGHGAGFSSGLSLGGHGGLDSGYGAGSEWKSW